MKIIALNGPPRSGKDTIAKAIVRIHEDDYRFKNDELGLPTAEWNRENGAPFPWGDPISIDLVAMIMPIRKVAFQLLAIPYSDALYEEMKDQPQEVFAGQTIRQFMISFMEGFIKPTYGQDFAVRVSMRQFTADKMSSIYLTDLPRLIVITDLGFREEVQFLSDLVGYENLFVVQLRRSETNFRNDSRRYQFYDQMNVFYNDGDPESVAKDIMMYAWVSLGWEY